MRPSKRKEPDGEEICSLYLKYQLERLASFSYQRWLKRSKTENFSDIAQLRIIYQSGINCYSTNDCFVWCVFSCIGIDYLGRPVIVFVGKNFSARTIDLDRV